MKRLLGHLMCDRLNLHTGPIECYGHYGYIKCDRCGELRKPMPRWVAEYRYGASV